MRAGVEVSNECGTRCAKPGEAKPWDAKTSRQGMPYEAIRTPTARPWDAGPLGHAALNEP
eukprot:4796907-Pyramimonas_sp.AAC.1